MQVLTTLSHTAAGFSWRQDLGESSSHSTHLSPTLAVLPTPLAQPERLCVPGEEQVQTNRQKKRKSHFAFWTLIRHTGPVTLTLTIRKQS